MEGRGEGGVCAFVRQPLVLSIQRCERRWKTVDHVVSVLGGLELGHRATAIKNDGVPVADSRSGRVFGQEGEHDRWGVEGCSHCSGGSSVWNQQGTGR